VRPGLTKNPTFLTMPWYIRQPIESSMEIERSVVRRIRQFFYVVLGNIRIYNSLLYIRHFIVYLISFTTV
jgi:hypothetical protein